MGSSKLGRSKGENDVLHRKILSAFHLFLSDTNRHKHYSIFIVLGC